MAIFLGTLCVHFFDSFFDTGAMRVTKHIMLKVEAVINSLIYLRCPGINCLHSLVLRHPVDAIKTAVYLKIAAHFYTLHNHPTGQSKPICGPEPARGLYLWDPWSRVLKKFRRILQKHDVPVQFKPSNTLRQRLNHPKDKRPRRRQSTVVYAIQCQEGCNALYIWQTKQPNNMARKRRTTSSGQDSAGHLDQKENGHFFEDGKLCVPAREARWFERSVTEAIHVKL